MRVRYRRLIGEACKVLACILVYAGVTGAIAASAIHVIAVAAELKCDLCTEPGRVLALAFGPKAGEAPGAVPDLPADAPTGSIPGAAPGGVPGLALRGALAAQ